jgi:hypothetical protein
MRLGRVEPDEPEALVQRPSAILVKRAENNGYGALGRCIHNRPQHSRADTSALEVRMDHKLPNVDIVFTMVDAAVAAGLLMDQDDRVVTVIPVSLEEPILLVIGPPLELALHDFAVGGVVNRPRELTVIWVSWA